MSRVSVRSTLRSGVATCAAFQALSAPQREQVRLALAELLGDAFSVKSFGYGRLRFLSAWHRVWRVRFLLVPGGEFEMGLRDSDVDEASELVDWTRAVADTIEEAKRIARPVRLVRVAPFLCSVATLSVRRIKRVSEGTQALDQVSGRDVAPLFRHCPEFRLPSEAELEYLAREGGELAFTYDGARRYVETERWPWYSAWGFRRLMLGEWCADSLHPNYEGAPSTSEAWAPGAVPGVFRGMLPSGPDENADLILGLAALRGPMSRVPLDSQCLRLARSLDFD